MVNRNVGFCFKIHFDACYVDDIFIVISFQIPTKI